MTDGERRDDSGRLQIPFPPDDPEAPASGNASGRSRLSDHRLSDPDSGPATGRSQRPARLTGARHRPGHAVGRAAPASSNRSDGPDGESDSPGETLPPPSNGAASSSPGPEPAPEDGGGDGLAAERPASPDSSVEAAEPATSPDPGSDGAAASGPDADAPAPAPRFAAPAAWGAAVAGRLKQVRLPQLPQRTRTPDAPEPTMSGSAPAPAVTAAPDPTGAAAPPATEPAPSGRRRPRRRPDMAGLEDMRAGTKSGRTPDWMARRIAEFEAPGAAYELGKQRRWRRRKITVLRSRADRRLVRRIDTWTVFKVSFMFYLLMLIIVLIAGIATWNVAEHLGFIGDIQKSVRSLADDKSFVFHGQDALRWAALGGAALGLLGTLFNTVAAMLYNLLSDVVGGLQVIVVTEPD